MASVSFSPDGTKLACSTEDDIRVYDVKSDTPIFGMGQGPLRYDLVCGAGASPALLELRYSGTNRDTPPERVGGWNYSFLLIIPWTTSTVISQSTLFVSLSLR